MRKPGLSLIIKTTIILLIGLLASIIAANRSDNGKNRNDTAAYAAHHHCIASQKTIDQCRSEIGGLKYEFLYEQTIGFLAQKLDFNNFYHIKIATALTIYTTILLAVGLQSRNPTLSILILLLDFRFWEYGTNVLRHGFAAAFIAASTLLLNQERPRWSLLSRALATASHLSAAIILFIPTKRYKPLTLTLLTALVALVVAKSEYWIPLALESDLLEYKINHYLRNTDGYNFSLPFHYALFITIGLYLYFKTNSKSFIATFNYIVPLFLASIVLGYLDASYRMASFMLPIIAINIPDQISLLTKKFKEKELAEKILTGLTGIALAFIAYRNQEFFMIHLA